MSNNNQINNSCFFGDNVDFIEEIYKRYQKGDESITEDWKNIFSHNLEYKNSINTIHSNEKIKRLNSSTDFLHKAIDLINFFRTYGHTAANLDPLNLTEKAPINYETLFDINKEQLNRSINLSGTLGLHNTSFTELLETCQKIYCSNIGFEFMHITNHNEREWLQNKIENKENFIEEKEKKEILEHLIETELFEQFIHIKYPGYKRFSIEGGESAIIALEKIISESSSYDIQKIILGMAHRGRLNVLTKVMGKSYTAMLSEFQGGLPYPSNLEVSGDVKYHMGYSCNRQLSNGKTIRLSLCSNPSHLEAINPVAMGRTRAKQDKLTSVSSDSGSVINVLIHGDASFSGQGIIYECFTLSNLPGYQIGGTIHIIINNQIGFTTNPQNARSSLYCSDIAKFIGAPIFHINGDDPESVAWVSKIAMEYRQKFHKDVVLDIVCYRRYGHNEGDEPMFTQPIMYQNIAKHKTIAKIYNEKLISEKIIKSEESESLFKRFRSKLDENLSESSNYQPTDADWFKGTWSKLRRPALNNFNDYLSNTGVSKEKLLDLAKFLNTIPKEFTANKKIDKLFKSRIESINSDNIDWANAESLALATLLTENFRIRLSGQDCGRGTFSQRHAKIIDQVNGKEYIPLNNLGIKQEKFEVIDSPLSEYAVMGFEYGYSTDFPYGLTLWEGQFGDFANGAQIIIDQFISSAESKWLRSSGLVLLLPHGYEGQGPEHSSGRIERYLQLCAEDNMQVVNCTTPANYFHALRRQLHRDFRKPLIVFTPKSLLRHKLAVSKLEDFTKSFLPIIPEAADLSNDQDISKVIVCSGKLYYDIIEAREEHNIRNIAVIRLEQYYPFPTEYLKTELEKYQNADIIWCQEEPLNMGGWTFVSPYIDNILNKINIKAKRSGCIARPGSSSTASGYATIHSKQQQLILCSALNIDSK